MGSLILFCRVALPSYCRWKPGRGGRVHWAVGPARPPPDSLVAAGAAPATRPTALGTRGRFEQQFWESRAVLFWRNVSWWPINTLCLCFQFFLSFLDIHFADLLQRNTGSGNLSSAFSGGGRHELVFRAAALSRVPVWCLCHEEVPVSLAGFLLLMCCLNILLLSAGAGCKAVLLFFF